MTTFTDDELAALRAVAEAAPQWNLDVCWESCDCGGDYPCVHGEYPYQFQATNHLVKSWLGNMGAFSWSEVSEMPGELAAHIAAFDPPTVLRLLAELAAARARLAELETAMQEAYDNCETCRNHVGTGRCARCQTFWTLLNELDAKQAAAEERGDAYQGNGPDPLPTHGLGHWRAGQG